LEGLRREAAVEQEGRVAGAAHAAAAEARARELEGRLNAERAAREAVEDGLRRATAGLEASGSDLQT
jgi:hypothetical protein